MLKQKTCQESHRDLADPVIINVQNLGELTQCQC